MSGTRGDEEDGWGRKGKAASMETAKLADSISRNTKGTVCMREPIKDVARDEHSVKLQMGFDIMDSEFYRIHADRKCVQRCGTTLPSDLILNGMRRQRSWSHSAAVECPAES